MTVNPERFVEVWQLARTPEEVCKKLAMDRRAISNYAANLRRRGIPLKKFPANKRNTTRSASLSKEQQQHLKDRAVFWFNCFVAECRRRGEEI